MFKKKGSSTNVAIVCSLICAGFGVYYGLNANKSETVASDAFSASVVDSAEAVGEAPAAVYHTPDGPALNPTPAKKGGKSVVVSSDGKPVAARDLKVNFAVDTDQFEVVEDLLAASGATGVPSGNGVGQVPRANPPGKKNAALSRGVFFRTK